MCPPLWYYLVNPRCQALKDLNEGKTENKFIFNNITGEKMCEKEFKIQCAGWTYMFLF